MGTSGDIRIRVSNNQKQRLKQLAEFKGFRTLSDFIRSKIFQDDISIHQKLNEILEEIKK